MIIQNLKIFSLKKKILVLGLTVLVTQEHSNRRSKHSRWVPDYKFLISYSRNRHHRVLLQEQQVVSIPVYSRKEVDLLNPNQYKFLGDPAI